MSRKTYEVPVSCRFFILSQVEKVRDAAHLKGMTAFLHKAAHRAGRQAKGE
jgi:hypothetical protein